MIKFRTIITSITVCLLMMPKAFLPVFAQDSENDFFENNYFDKELGIYGKSLVPRFILPGFILSDPANQDYTFPMYRGVLSEDLPKLTEKSSIQLLESEELPQTEASEQADGPIGVLILSSSISDNKEFAEKNPLVDFFIISETVPVKEVFINDKIIDIQPDYVVQLDVPLDLSEGSNDVTVRGFLEDGSAFNRRYKTLYREKITDKVERDWVLVLNAEVGLDFNSGVSIYRPFSTIQVADLNESPKTDLFSQYELIFFDIINSNFDWYAGASTVFYLEKASGSLANRYSFYTSLNFYASAFNSSAWGVFSYYPGRGETYSSVGGRVSYDFNYTDSPHSGFILSGSLVKNFNNLPPSNRKGSLLSYKLNLKYNGYYLVDWISLTSLDFEVGNEDSQTQVEQHFLAGSNLKFTWNKTFWDLFLSFSYYYKSYYHHFVQDYAKPVQQPPTIRRVDHILTPAVRFRYTLYDGLSAYSSASLGLVFSNFLPQIKPIWKIGIEYLY